MRFGDAVDRRESRADLGIVRAPERHVRVVVALLDGLDVAELVARATALPYVRSEQIPTLSIQTRRPDSSRSRNMARMNAVPWRRLGGEGWRRGT